MSVSEADAEAEAIGMMGSCDEDLLVGWHPDHKGPRVEDWEFLVSLQMVRPFLQKTH